VLRAVKDKGKDFKGLAGLTPGKFVVALSPLSARCSAILTPSSSIRFIFATPGMRRLPMEGGYIGAGLREECLKAVPNLGRMAGKARVCPWRKRSCRRIFLAEVGCVVRCSTVGDGLAVERDAVGRPRSAL
jgi:hypothetical protein